MIRTEAKNIYKGGLKLKSKGILFFFLLFVLSLAGCTVQSKDNAPDTTVTVDSTSNSLVSEPPTSSTEYQMEVGQIIQWLERSIDDTSYEKSFSGTGCRVTWYEDTKIEIRKFLYELPENKCPSWVSMVRFAPPGHVGYFRVCVSSDINELSDEFQLIFENQYNTTLFIKDFDIMSFFNLELESIPEAERPTIQITQGSNGYTEAEITFE